MTVTARLPSSRSIQKQIELCRAELEQLKRQFRATVSAERADAARAERQQETSNAQKCATP